MVPLPCALLGALLCVAADCPGGDDGPDPPTECFFGDENASPEGELVFLDENFVVQPFTDGQRVPAILPPQGGKVIFIGVRLKNMDMCSIQANGGVFDDCQTPPRVIGREGRALSFVLNEASGFAEPANPETINNYVNIPLCGNFTSSRDIDDEPYRIELRISDRAQRALVFRAELTPFCAGAPNTDGTFEQCLCECDAEFSFDLTCEEILIDDDREPGVCPE